MTKAAVPRPPDSLVSMEPEPTAMVESADRTATEQGARLGAAVDGATQAEQAAVRELADLERNLTRERSAAASRLAEMQASTAGEVYGALGAGQKSPHALLAKKKAEGVSAVEALDGAIAAARRERLLALRDLAGARAAAIREQAQPLTDEADGLEEKAATLKAALEAFAGCDYEIKGPLPAGPGAFEGTQAIRVPRWVALRRKAAVLQRRAAQLEATPVRDRGGVDADSIENLLEAILGDGTC